MVKTITSILLLFLCFGAASAICRYPCFRFEAGTWVSDRSTFVWSCSDLSVLTLNGFDKRMCYARSGPFLVSRRGNTYRCIKYTAYNSKAGVSLVYITEPKTYFTEPSICDVCSGRYSPQVLIAKRQNYERARQLIAAPLGCNRPPLCPIKDWFNDKPCDDSEPTFDDGFMCKSCIRY
ncbi:unnamed protein product [Mytilus coruscus]|uniref:Uncharacterized protein n=1 Tax=Mytilus coruscus TaxID=42192 RepID=A0A6J8B0T5_MYTCO|nr:unnamed protein product [Mytilus coruscus]